MRAILAWGFCAAQRKPAYGSVGRPPCINPTITEIANSTIATKNTILAASIATPAIMPKPSNAATSATIRKVIAQPYMSLSSPRLRHESRVLGNVICSDLVPLLWSSRHTTHFQSWQNFPLPRKRGPTGASEPRPLNPFITAQAGCLSHPARIRNRFNVTQVHPAKFSEGRRCNHRTNGLARGGGRCHDLDHARPH